MAGKDAMEIHGKGGKGKGRKTGFEAGVNLNYNKEDDYEEPGYAHGFEGNVHKNVDGYEGKFASGNVGGFRAVSKENHIAAEAQGPQGCVGGGVSEDGYKMVCEGNLGEAKANAGPMGISVRSPGAVCQFEAGKKGVNFNAGAEISGGKLNVGPVNVGAGVGAKVVLQADADGAGAIIPDVGGLVLTKDGLEAAVGPVNVTINWSAPR